MKTLFLFLALGGGLPLAAQARPYHLTSVRWIVATRNNMDVDDRYVTMVGHVTRRMGDEEYWFADGTGQVRLDSENFDLPIGPRVVISGRIDQAYLGFGHLEVDVRGWHYAPLRRVVAVTHRAPVTAVAPVSVSAPATSSTPNPPTSTTTPTTTAGTNANTAPSLAPPPETH